MIDLSNWNAAEIFSGQEAAALMSGFDPSNPQAETWRAKPILDRIMEGHRQARVIVSQPLTVVEFEIARESAPDALFSVLFDLYPTLQKEAWPGDTDRSYELPRRLSGPDGDFSVQRFTRFEIKRWIDRCQSLSKIGFSSMYPFTKSVQAFDSVADEGLKGARWPAHETKALTALRLAALKFWVNYDHNDPTTAPFNKQVIAWLVDEQKISMDIAKAMATILRADGLRPGPREKS